MPEEIPPVSPTPPAPPPPPTTTLPERRINTATVAAIIIILALLGYLAWRAYPATPAGTSSNQATSSAQTTTTSATIATPAAIPATVTISAALKENISSAISSGNTAALEGYMASSVNVVIAASDKTGAESPAQAVADLSYLSSGTAPWNFNLSAATLTSFKNGFYGQYFGNDTYVGESANTYVVSFGINASGKIATVFMAQNADLLK